MNKELTPLEALKKFRDNIRWLEENTSLKHYFENDKLHFKENLDIIETALKRLEEIDKYLYLNNKKLKAIEIIKEKAIKERLLVIDWEDEFPNCHEVGDYTGYAIYDYKGSTFVRITKEEFDLLKECFK